MTTGSATLGAARAVGDEHAARLDWRDDLVTALPGLWLLAGLFVDGWAHFNLAQLETFFTPWPPIFYLGYGASAAWLCWLIRRGRRAGRVSLAAILITNLLLAPVLLLLRRWRPPFGSVALLFTGVAGLAGLAADGL